MGKSKKVKIPGNADYYFGSKSKQKEEDSKSTAASSSSSSSSSTTEYNPSDYDEKYLYRSMQLSATSLLSMHKIVARVQFPSTLPEIAKIFHSHLPVEERPLWSCNHCMNFLERYGNLVVLTDENKWIPLFWNQQRKEELHGFHSIVTAIHQLFYHPATRLSSILYVSKDTVLGVESNYDANKKKQWFHMSYKFIHDDFKHPTHIEDHEFVQFTEMLKRILTENTMKHFDTAHDYLVNNRLVDTSHHVEPIKWICGVGKEWFSFSKMDDKSSSPPSPSSSSSSSSTASSSSTSSTSSSSSSSSTVITTDNNTIEQQQSIFIWRTVFKSYTGVINTVRSGMIGLLLSWIRSGDTLEQCRTKWEEKMGPHYRVSIAAPGIGNIKAAERLMSEFKIPDADFKRYYFKYNDPQLFSNWHHAVLFASRKLQEEKAKFGILHGINTMTTAVTSSSSSSSSSFSSSSSYSFPRTGIFSAVKSKQDLQRERKNKVLSQEEMKALPERKISLSTFVNKILLEAKEIMYQVHENMAGFNLITGSPTSHPLLVWHHENNRVGWYTLDPWQPCSQWNLIAANYTSVICVMKFPHMWFDMVESKKFKAHGNHLFLALEGAKDITVPRGGGLWKDHLSSKFREVDRTIEAIGNKNPIIDLDPHNPQVCGIQLTEDRDGVLKGGPHIFIVIGEDGKHNKYSVNVME